MTTEQLKQLEDIRARAAKEYQGMYQPVLVSVLAGMVEDQTSCIKDAA